MFNGIPQIGLGTDDLMFAVILGIGIYLVRFWLMKIYMRIRQIAKILEHYYKKEIGRKGE